ncbi:hypothetical protein OJF2_22900 [Aquisphaera giovannonii]|uniref:DUF1559 domain-containing protein n=1 Tax=Aquisphaera giovannonii TaxID=406548 RepID=A0A5B9W0E9_9BACT|nr:hypothetical protein [Aquisphaera giovannonii]QEH33761.1 hypothetical protein OJF2_22900 [Aquisphaera giovannonii]
MNADEMIDHVMGRLDSADRERMERAIGGDPELSSRVEVLSHRLHILLDDGDAPEPPAGLHRRTMMLVARERSRPRALPEFAPSRSRFRWADLAVAASIFLAGTVTLIPAIQHSRERMAIAGCAFNLQQLGQSFAQYASLNRSYPYPPEQKTDAPAGSFAAFLHDAGLLDDLSILDCPRNGRKKRPGELPSFTELETLRRTDPARYGELLQWDYAYNVGHRQESGMPGPVDPRPAMAVPVAADAPAHENYARILAGNSPNHGGRGQNVLFSDGSVRNLSTRKVSPRDPDLFLNNLNQLRPGVDEQDSVVSPSYSSFVGTPAR